MSDLDKLIRQASKSGDVAHESSKKETNESTVKPEPNNNPEPKKTVKKQKAKTNAKHKLFAGIQVDIRLYGKTPTSLPLIDFNNEWLENNTLGTKSAIVNYLIYEGIKQVEKKLKTEPVIITEDDLPKK